MIPLMLVLLMSAVPVALPVMFTVSMALGSKQLAKHGVLVTRLSAAEDAATMDVLCVDKTGTITMNQLAVIGVMPLASATEAEVLFAGALASQDTNQDPIDLAFLAAAKAHQVFDGVPSVTPIAFTPSDATNRRTEAVIEQNGTRLRVMKGAVRTIADACGLKLPEVERWRSASARPQQRAIGRWRWPAVRRRVFPAYSDWCRYMTLRDPTQRNSSPHFLSSAFQSRCSRATHCRWRVRLVQALGYPTFDVWLI